MCMFAFFYRFVVLDRVLDLVARVLWSFLKPQRTRESSSEADRYLKAEVAFGKNSYALPSFLA